MSKIKEFKKWLEERTEQMVGWDELEKKLRKKEKIKIKYGADPTKRDLHLGHAVSLRIMRRLQDEFDAEIQFLIGDFTAKVGDPTGKSKARPVLTDEQMKLNAETYATQIFRILDEKKMSTWCNGEKLAFVDNCQGGWWNNMKLPEFMNLLTLVTHARLIDRDMFQERIKNNQEIYMHEMMYPILQGYDSVMMKSDLTVIGSDQLFNELMGRFFQEKFGQPPQAVITAPILVGTDGKEKMSKSVGNYIGLTDSADEMYGKTMSIPDDVIVNWAKLATDLDYKKIAAELESGKNPRDVKAEVAHDIVRIYHGEKKAREAADNFVKVFAKRENPEDMMEIELSKDEKISIVDLIVVNKLASSKSQARRLLEQGAVKIDGKKIGDADYLFLPQDGMVIKVGKRRFAKIVKKGS